ncbi:alpha/beta hydrolase [uncultured Roseobacter sp.]|uniref:alpha/beta fold hydrolase n=1 Tax=uncultured Roseobacter sp. TaxID=114847 RepID=UPI00262790DB|nr:alpha/beta hydrolase [uncultured Roseobacter sp.]
MKTHSRSFGHGSRQALAIHCALAHSGVWHGLAAVLGDQLTLHAIDLPGHGRSDDWDGQTDLCRLSTQAALTRMTEPMDVVGHSFGAVIALRVAAERPALVRSLTLIEPVFFAAAARDAPDRMAAYEALATPCFDALERGEPVVATRAFNRMWGDGTEWQDIPPATRDYLVDRIHLVQGQAPGIVHDNAGLLAPDILPKANMPCLMIQGSEAPDIIYAIVDSLCTRLPNVRRVCIDGAGHMAPLTHAEAVAKEMRALLKMTEE